MRYGTLFRFPALVSLLAVLSFLAATPGSGFSQSQLPAATDQPAATSAPPAPAKAQAAPLPNAKPAKVWTNDEIDALRNNHNVSVVGTRLPQNVSATSKGNSQEKDPAWYRRQLAPLRAEIDKLDGQITRMQAFLSGENVSDPASLHPKMVPTPREQLKQMQDKRQSDQQKMDDLLDRARHNGVEPGALW
jgi:hypothetical protein